MDVVKHLLSEVPYLQNFINEKLKIQNMLGKKVKDIVSGFSGIATARCEYLNGCVQYQLEAPLSKTGERKKEWFDEGQLSITGTGITLKQKDNGGPVGRMPKFSHPK